MSASAASARGRGGVPRPSIAATGDLLCACQSESQTQCNARRRKVLGSADARVCRALWCPRVAVPFCLLARIIPSRAMVRSQPPSIPVACDYWHWVQVRVWTWVSVRRLRTGSRLYKDTGVISFVVDFGRSYGTSPRLLSAPRKFKSDTCGTLSNACVPVVHIQSRSNLVHVVSLRRQP